MPTVTVIDYGIGNLLSVARAFEYCGAEVVMTDSPDLILGARRLVLPGVGAFADGMKGLRERELIEPIKKYAASGQPFLGICLGMQMMFGTGEEFGTHQGLGLIPGKVVAIPDTGIDGNPHKIPHISWNQLLIPDHGIGWDNTILAGVTPKEFVYFIHSFTAVPACQKHRLADSYYNGRLISAAVKSDSLYGCQFHPEKSGVIGLQIINNFASGGMV